MAASRFLRWASSASFGNSTGKSPGDEPLPPGYALAKRDNVVLMPHLGFVNDPSFEKFGTGAVENLMNWLEGRPLVRLQTGT